MDWPIKAAAVRLASPGSSPTSAIRLRKLAAEGQTRDVVILPIGFCRTILKSCGISITKPGSFATQLGMNMVRGGTVGGHPDFVRMIRELIFASASRRAETVAGILRPQP